MNRKWNTQKIFSLGPLLNTDIWKWWKHINERCYFVPSCLYHYQWHDEQGQNEQQKYEMYMSHTSLFLLFIGKEWTNMAVPWGVSLSDSK